MCRPSDDLRGEPYVPARRFLCVLRRTLGSRQCYVAFVGCVLVYFLVYRGCPVRIPLWSIALLAFCVLLPHFCLCCFLFRVPFALQAPGTPFFFSRELKNFHP